MDQVFELQYALDTFYFLICGALVMWMAAGFAMLEAGLVRAKNTTEILTKNVALFAIACIMYLICGYAIMYDGGWFVSSAIAPDSLVADALAAKAENGFDGDAVYSTASDFFFQVVFVATAMSIVSGAVAERMKLWSFLLFSVVMTGFIYPISGYWKWGGGWLDQLGFYDFAGSLVVHAVGGFAGLAGAMVLGPRIGRFSKSGKPNAMPGSNLALSALGVLILWIGWYGFNPGSQLAIVGVDNTNAVMLIAVNTTLAAAAGAVFAMFTAWYKFKKPDLTMALNGALAGLVGITANCDSVTNLEAIIIGLVAGILVVGGILLLDKLKIDDPVGAWPVHGLCGIWGGIATGIFGGHPIVAQIIGSVAIPIWAFVTMYILFSILKALKMLRVSEEEELLGLDISEHKEEAYAGFQIFTVE